jgi:hypothetical protein
VVGPQGLTRPVLRGQVWFADLGLGENKRLLIFSNNQRNKVLSTVFGLYVTSNMGKPDIPSIAKFAPGEIGELACCVLTDEPWVLEKKYLQEIASTATPGVMRRVEEALKAALDMT